MLQNDKFFFLYIAMDKGKFEILKDSIEQRGGSTGRVLGTPDSCFGKDSPVLSR